MRLPFRPPSERPEIPDKNLNVRVYKLNGKSSALRLGNWGVMTRRNHVVVALFALLFWSLVVWMFSNSVTGSAQGRDIGSADQVAAVAEPVAIPLTTGSEKTADLADVLLLYDSTHLTDFDHSFCRLAEFYGLMCEQIALDTTELTDDVLKDPQGAHFKLVGISGDALLGDRSLLSSEELGILRSAIETQGVNLLVSKVHDNHTFSVLYELTDGNVVEVVKPKDDYRDWFVSAAAPEITREFTGQVVSAEAGLVQDDFALVLEVEAPVTSLIMSRDNRGYMYPIFIRYKQQTGAVWVDAGGAGSYLNERPLRDAYYSPNEFSRILPLMFTLRYVLGDETWHNDHNYANLTIDDPALTEPFGHLSFVKLLSQMKLYNFHTTIATHPVTYQESEPLVVDLFLANPDRFSLVQHGNNGDGYEFYKYTVSENDEYNGAKLPARPFEEQKADIVEGMARMAKHTELTGIPFDKVMVFPWGISPQRTLELLKGYNYLGTVNAQTVPLEEQPSALWSFGVHPAVMDYGSFPILTRRRPGSYEPFRPNIQPSVFDLFVDKPALFYSHENQLFVEGIHTFNKVADQMNNLYGELEWRSLGYILRHLYLEKTNDDGSVDVRMYGNHLVIANAANQERTFYLSKEEDVSVPIDSVTVQGQRVPYRVEDGYLKLDLRLPAFSTQEILVQYAESAEGRK